MKKILFLLFLPLSGFATHNISGGITYKHVGGYNYEITITTYTKALSPADRCELPVHFGDGDSAMALRVNGPVTNCPPFGDGVMITPLIKENIYIVYHTYSGNGNYYITMYDPNRESGIVNIPNSINTPFAFKAFLVINPFVTPNNSPDFNSIPIDTGYIYNYFAYYPNAAEADGDSLVYNWIPCLGLGVQPISGYIFPINSYINSQNGTLAWSTPLPETNPPWAGFYPQNYSYVIQISEYRFIGNAWTLVGQCMQDIFVSIEFSMGISENNPSTNISLFPNPSNTEINFTVNGVTEKENILVITDITGKQVQIIKDIKNGENKIPVSTLAPGLYFYNLNNSKGKFIVSQ